MRAETVCPSQAAANRHSEIAENSRAERWRSYAGVVLALALGVLIASGSVTKHALAQGEQPIIDTLGSAGTTTPFSVFGSSGQGINIGDFVGPEFILTQPTVLTEVGAILQTCRRIDRGVPDCPDIQPFLVEIRPALDGKPDPAVVIATFTLSNDQAPLTMSYESARMQLPLPPGTYFALFRPQRPEDGGYIVSTATSPFWYVAGLVRFGLLRPGVGERYGYERHPLAVRILGIPETAVPVPLDGSIHQLSATGTYLPNDPRAPAGVYRIVFGFRNVSPYTFTDLQAQVTQLDADDTIVNRDGAPTSQPAGVGAVLTVPDTALGTNDSLSPNETFTQVIEVGLQRREPFRISFTGTGVPVVAGAGQAAAASVGAQRQRAGILSVSAEFSPEASDSPTPGGEPTPIPSPGVPGAGQPPAGSPSACAPRPKIAVQTAQAGPGQIAATITTEATASQPDNALKAVRLTGVSNARVQVVGGPALTSGNAYTPPSGQREVRLLVTREQPGPMTAHLEVEDGCGTHPTFVGAGAGIR